MIVTKEEVGSFVVVLNNRVVGSVMDILTIDFETYYDREFSLSKITTRRIRT
jgi:hypothetical protein